MKLGRRLLCGLSMLLAFALSGCSTDPGPVAPDVEDPAAKLTAGQGVPGQYIVVLRDDVTDVEGVARGLARQHGAVPEHVYRYTIKGFSVALPEPAIQALQRNPQVAYIEPDQVATAVGIHAKPSPPTPAPQTIPWGVTRVGGAGTGAGKTAWVIDTGIDLDHPDLLVDVARSQTFVTRTRNADDANGHGTHVAGTIAAVNNSLGVVGVAAGARVVAVRVLDSRGSGLYSWVIAGVDYVAANGAWGDVANMSLIGGPSEALDTAVLRAADGGVRFALAAGNDRADANNYSPARVNGANVYTVSAIDINGTFASFSNYGNPPVDYAAPGVRVYSTYKGGAYATMSGTSMAAPHVAGLLLLGTVSADGTASSDPDGNADPIAHR